MHPKQRLVKFTATVLLPNQILCVECGVENKSTASNPILVTRRRRAGKLFFALPASRAKIT